MNIQNIFTVVSQSIENCPEGGLNEDNPSCLSVLPEVAADGQALTDIMSIVFGIISAVAVIIIIVQAIKFTLSSGEPEKAAAARKGIIYAAVGLAISLAANGIIVLVLSEVV
jgi:hypothetical protein